MYSNPLFLVIFTLILSCNSTKQKADKVHSENFKYLALGDSYTIGESVCNSCNFPNQLSTELENKGIKISNVNIIARTGWTTTQLINAISNSKLDPNYDIVTLLIGVNNEYQNLDFNIYKKEFPVLLNKAIELANNNSNKVIVLSIPDYAYTPFGQSINNNSNISKAIDNYNTYAASVCKLKGVSFLNITDITRLGLENPKLVAKDGLHPSKEAYTKFVKRLLPLTLSKIN